ncbi:MAG TPA: hypothetical protein VFJ50_00800 [Gemmatimonadales bacterium]|jgi:hypothetical protein|nr:hypothetical protein [Gemmatimonadales bacterium]
MASSSKKRTTMAKMNRENSVREKRMRKAARKEARKLEEAPPTAPVEPHQPEDVIGDPDPSGVGR